MRLFSLKSAILIIVIAVCVSLVSHLLPQKLAGSFEYIRKGEALFDKGRYLQALKYFEKAHTSSPDSDVIASELVYAYSTYSAQLAEAGKHDEAIAYLQKAYELTPNSSTAQNLALAYSEKALDEIKKNSIESAQNSYSKARQYASRSGTVSRNIGVTLYNDGISEFRSGREDAAILCFKESSKAYKDPRTFEILGDIYYKRADLKMARYYWHMAYLMGQASDALQEKLAKIPKEMALAAKENRDSLPHFEIRYAQGLSIDKDLAEKTLESAYKDIGKDLGYFPAYRTKVFFYSKEDFKRIFDMPYFVKAFYDGSIKMPAPQNYLDKEKFSEYIYHEYTHAIISAKTNNNCPVWLSEGIAVWEEVKKGIVDMKKNMDGARIMPDISFKFLDKSFESAEMDRAKAISYMVSYTLVDFILDRWGMQGLRSILKRLANKQHIVNAIDDEFLISEGDFEKKWRSYVAEKFLGKTSSVPTEKIRSNSE